MDARPHPLQRAVGQSRRSDLVLISIVLLFYFLFYFVAPVFLNVSWASHNAGMQMQVAGLGMTVLYIVCD